MVKLLDRNRVRRTRARFWASGHSADKDAAFGKLNLIVRKGPDGAMQVARIPIPEMPAELRQVIEEMK